MTIPGGYTSTFGRGTSPPFEDAAAATIAAARAHLEPQRALPPRPLTAEEKAEAEKAAEEHRYCLLCGGLHAAPSTPACPRLATFKLDGDQRIVEGSFWPGTDWAQGRVLFAEDVAEEEAGDESSAA